MMYNNDLMSCYNLLFTKKDCATDFGPTGITEGAITEKSGSGPNVSSI